jgi:hypothetical protein
MRLTEVLIRHQALKDGKEQLKCRLMKVAKAQGGDMPTEQPQELLAALEVHLQDLQVVSTPSHPANTQVTLADGTALMQVIAACDHPNLWRGILEARVMNTLPAQERSTSSAKGRSDGGHRDTTYSGRPAVHDLRRAGRHDLEGGVRHVPAIVGPAHSQAPPIPQVGQAGTRTAPT